PISNARFFRVEEQALAKAQRKHQVALDTNKALRAALTQQVQAAHPDLEPRKVWPAVSHDDDERTAWCVRQQRRQVVARTHERTRWRRNNFTQHESRRLVWTPTISWRSKICRCGPSLRRCYATRQRGPLEPASP